MDDVVRLFTVALGTTAVIFGGFSILDAYEDATRAPADRAKLARALREGRYEPHFMEHPLAHRAVGSLLIASILVRPILDIIDAQGH